MKCARLDVTLYKGVLVRFSSTEVDLGSLVVSHFAVCSCCFVAELPMCDDKDVTCNNGTCSDTYVGFHCTCPDDYVGVNCETRKSIVTLSHAADQ